MLIGRAENHSNGSAVERSRFTLLLLALAVVALVPLALFMIDQPKLFSILRAPRKTKIPPPAPRSATNVENAQNQQQQRRRPPTNHSAWCEPVGECIRDGKLNLVRDNSTRASALEWSDHIRVLWNKLLVTAGYDIFCRQRGGVARKDTHEYEYTLNELDRHGVCIGRPTMDLRLFEHVVQNALAAGRLPIVYVEAQELHTFLTKMLLPIADALEAGNKTTILQEGRVKIKIQTTPLVVLTGLRDYGPSAALYSRPLGYHQMNSGPSKIDPPAGKVPHLMRALDSDAVHFWFAMNCDTKHRKIACIPIGVNYHDDIKHRARNPLTVDRSVVSSACNATNRFTTFGDRALQVVIGNWSLASNPLRTEIKSELVKQLGSLVLTAGERLECDELMRRHGAAAFVAAPPGWGWDCHRNVEVLIMGAVPIMMNAIEYRKTWTQGVPKSEWPSQNQIYDHLPVVFVKSYAEVTVKNLRGWQQQIEARHKAGLYRMERLTNKYWVERMRFSARDGFERWSSWDGTVGSVAAYDLANASGDPHGPPPEKESERVGVAPLSFDITARLPKDVGPPLQQDTSFVNATKCAPT